MKVLHFYRTYFPDTQGGLEEAIRQICIGTKSHGVESRVLTLSPNPAPIVIHFPEADVYRARLDIDIASCSMGIETFPMFRELEAWADIIHYHFPWPFADVVRLWSRSKKPSVVTYHSDIVRQRWLAKLYRPLMNTFLRSATKIVATSPNYAETSPVLKDYKQKLAIIPIGLDESTYPPVNATLVKNFEAKYGDNFFLFVGVLREYKGLHILLEAARGAPFSVLIAGKGPLEATLKQRAQELSLSNVHFVGYISDEIKIALLHSCRGVVLPSHLRSEAFGVSLVEAEMMGKPMISTDIGTGTTYVNIHGNTGLVCKPSDPASLREAISRLHENPDYAQSLGAGARSRFEQLFTADLMGIAYLRTYRAALQRDNAGSTAQN